MSASNCYDRTCRPLEPIFGSTVQGMLLRQCSLQLLPPPPTTTATTSASCCCTWHCYSYGRCRPCVIALLCTSGPKHPSILQTQLEREQSPYKGVGQVQALNEAVHVARVVPWWVRCSLRKYGHAPLLLHDYYYYYYYYDYDYDYDYDYYYYNYCYC